MTRCDYDTIFQRVFCVTLVAIALTFTVILTNVFVDIDGILSSKEKTKPYDVPVPVLESEIHQVKVSNLIRPETFYKEEKNYDEDNEENYRNKRSLESSNFLFHVKNPKMKNILTNRLAKLLEELDEEETVPDKKNTEEHKHRKTKDDGALEVKENGIEKKDEDDMLHLAMHNILLQGIIGHMDLNDVYRKVHALIRNFKDMEEGETAKEKRRAGEKEKTDKEPILNEKAAKDFPFPKPIESKRTNAISRNPSLEENKFFEEIIKDNIVNTKPIKTIISPRDIKFRSQQEPKLLIKTIIDITSNKEKPQKDLNLNSKDTIKGIIKLFYNGKSVKFSRMEEDDTQRNRQNDKISENKDIDDKPNDEIKDTDITDQINTMMKKSPKPERRRSNTFYNKIIDDYFKKYKKTDQRSSEERLNDKIETKRLKRHIKIRYEDDEPTTLKPKRQGSSDDDELFVEIETHFDSKGMKGDKKKKMIRNIIDKIQKAIHADIDKINDGSKKKHKHMGIKKRSQNPLDKDKKMLINKNMLTYDRVEERHSDPISKTLPSQTVADKSGESWKKSYYGPGFLTLSKSLNSAEMGEVDVDYNKIMTANGIPQRLQKPLNTDVSDEMLNSNANTFFDLGNLKFYIKNIDGAGLSIGFNQYTDEPPDPETIKLFTGIENLVKTYHSNDATEGPLSIPDEKLKLSSSEEKMHQLSKRDVIDKRNKHLMIRRSIEETSQKDYHSNEYKIIFDNNFLPYNSYQEIYEDKKKRVALTIDKKTEKINTFNRDSDDVEIIRKNIEIKELPSLMDENNNIFYKKLKPSEILSIASMLDRQKRSMNLQKIRNLNKKLKVNRYLNTRTMGSRNKIILNKKRNKRQIDKIRIIATDSIGKQRHPEDNFYIVGDENLMADRAIIREVETPDTIDNIDEKGEQYDMLPLIYEDPPYVTNVFDGKSRHNQLMSKYPHVFMEEVSKSKEDFEPVYISKILDPPSHGVLHPDFSPFDNINKEINFTMTEPPISKFENLVHAIDPNQHYKLTVKILPKNITGENTGFKEIHASINKSFNKDGLRYSSLVNVSEISKVENLKKTFDLHPDTMAHMSLTTPATFMKKMQEQQNRMDMLLKQHKKRIDEQLDNLKKERQHLETITVKHLEETVTEAPENTKSIANNLLTHPDVSKLLASAFLKLQTENEFTTVTTTTTEKPTSEMTVLRHETNDNINNEILNQINKNTQMLQTFLQKLTDKLSKEKQKSEEVPKDFSRVWKPFLPFPASPDIYSPRANAKNDTEIFPFVYAFQPPFALNPFKQAVHTMPVASVVYHSHIHADSMTNHLNQIGNDNVLPATKVHDKNQTKYFVDGVIGDKGLPVKKMLKPVVVPVNATVMG